MARNIQNKWADVNTRALLDRLVQNDTMPAEYRDIMYQLGRALGNVLHNQFNIDSHKVCIACTVEDADFLGKGILDEMEKVSEKLFITVFWNKRFKPYEDNDISIAPILREFHDPGYTSANILIVLKSIISNACVVKTNLTRLIEQSTPDKIYIVAPVLLKDAPQKLEKEFPPEVAHKFEYLYFAEDTERTSEGMVVPGIGGDVYQRLGFDGQESKNRYTPDLVLERRARASTG
jgi:hypothetical protein